MLSLYKLEIFNMVSMEGSFSKAAGRLLLTQPAVSQHIRDLEASLHTELFARGPRGVVLTAAGEILLDYTRCILQMIAEAESAVMNLERLESGQVAIGATPGAAVYLLPGWINAFHQRLPGLAVSLQTDTTQMIAENIRSGRLDLGFVEGELDAKPPVGMVMLDEIRLRVIVGKGHPWWDQPDVPVQDLHGQPFVTRPVGSHTRKWIDQLLAQHAVVPKIVAEFDNPEAIRKAVASGLGAAILPDWVLTAEPGWQVQALPIRDVELKRTLKLIWNEDNRLKPAVRAFLAYLVGQFPQLSQLATLTGDITPALPTRETYRASLSCRGSQAA